MPSDSGLIIKMSITYMIGSSDFSKSLPNLPLLINTCDTFGISLTVSKYAIIEKIQSI